MEEQLIESIKMQPCLFDKSSSLFRNKYLKERAWQSVAAAVGTSEEVCKTRWKSLRDRFVREMAGNKPKSGDAAPDRTKWCYMEQMRFLTKHIAPRRTTSNFEFNCYYNEEPFESSQQILETQQCESKEAGEESEEILEGSPSTCSNTPVIVTGSTPAKTSSTPVTKKRKRVGGTSYERFDRLCGRIESVIANRVHCAPTSDNSAFLKMLDECLQKKPEDVQARLKIDLLNYAHNAI